MSSHQIVLVWETPDGDKTETLILELSEKVSYGTAMDIFDRIGNQAQDYAIAQGYDGPQWHDHNAMDDADPGYTGPYPQGQM